MRISAPLRVDLSGGTLDIWPLRSIIEDAKTINCAINVKITVEFVNSSTISSRIGTVIAEYFKWKNIDLKIYSPFSSGGGLGGSSAILVSALKGGFFSEGKEISDQHLVNIAKDLEAKLLKLPTGVQDYYPALKGGVLKIEYLPGQENVTRFEDVSYDLSKMMVIVDSGLSHFSAKENWQIVKDALDEGRTLCLLKKIRDVTLRVEETLYGKDFDKLGKLILEEWNYRKQLHSGISTPNIEKIINLSVEEGALGGKVCGAGGGGYVLIVVYPELRDHIVQVLQNAGFNAYKIAVEENGIRIN